MNIYEKCLLNTAKAIYNSREFWDHKNMPDFPANVDVARQRACTFACQHVIARTGSKRMPSWGPIVSLMVMWNEEEEKHSKPGFRMSDITYRSRREIRWMEGCLAASSLNPPPAQTPSPTQPDSGCGGTA